MPTTSCCSRGLWDSRCTGWWCRKDTTSCFCPCTSTAAVKVPFPAFRPLLLGYGRVLGPVRGGWEKREVGGEAGESRGGGLEGGGVREGPQDILLLGYGSILGPMRRGRGNWRRGQGEGDGRSGEARGNGTQADRVLCKVRLVSENTIPQKAHAVSLWCHHAQGSGERISSKDLCRGPYQ